MTTAVERTVRITVEVYGHDGGDVRDLTPLAQSVLRAASNEGVRAYLDTLPETPEVIVDTSGRFTLHAGKPRKARS